MLFIKKETKVIQNYELFDKEMVKKIFCLLFNEFYLFFITNTKIIQYNLNDLSNIIDTTPKEIIVDSKLFPFGLKQVILFNFIKLMHL